MAASAAVGGWRLLAASAASVFPVDAWAASRAALNACPAALSTECLAFLWVVDWVQVKALEGHRVVEGSCGGTHTMVVTDEGRCFIWGRGAFGRCGALPALAGGCCAGSS